MTPVLAARLLAAAAVALWACSLAMPSLGASGGPTLTGLDVLRQGIDGWRYGVYAWFANPALLFSVLAGLAGRPRTALVLAGTALALAVSSFWAAGTAAAAGRPVPELLLFPGFYCWMAAHTAAVAGGIIGAVHSARSSAGHRRGLPRD